MLAKAVLLFCFQALLGQCISGQCIGAGNGFAEGMARGLFSPQYMSDVPVTVTWAAGPCTATPFATAEWATGFGPASNGGGFPIRSASPIAPTGVSMTSENVYEGPVSVSGAVPFVAAVDLEGALPTAGTGSINYGCGDGDVAMLSESITGYAAGPFGYGATAEAYGPLAYDAGIVGPYGYGPLAGPNAFGPLAYDAGITGPYAYGPLAYDAGIAGPNAFGPLAYDAGIAGPGYGYGFNRGCGYGAV